MEDLGYDGHEIALYAYCKECLEVLQLSHTAIAAQQEEYRALEQYFNGNQQWT